MKFDKSLSRPETAQSRLATGPEGYPEENVSRGFSVLGHIQRVRSPSMEKMLARDNKMYYINESSNLDPPKEARLVQTWFKTTLDFSPINHHKKHK